MDRSVVPAAPDAWLTALELYGTMTFEQVVTPALEIAEHGYPLPERVQRVFAAQAADKDGPMWNYPSLREVFMPGGRVLGVGDKFVQSDLARSFNRLIAVERDNASAGREKAIRAARDYFYKGEIAEEIASFVQEQGGLLTLDDMREFTVKVEPAVSGRFRDYEIYTCGPWCQGPMVAQTLQTLQDDDLASIGHNTPDYIHLLAGALNTAFADRERYYGDPDFVDVPMDDLLSPGYTRSRREEIDMACAWGEMPPPGDPTSNGSAAARPPAAQQAAAADGDLTDTSYTCVVDRWGNAFLRDAQRRIVLVAHRARPWVHRIRPRLADVAGRRPRLQPSALEAPKADSEPRDRLQGRRALHAVWLPGRRRPATGHGPDIPEHRRVRHGRAGRNRSAQVHLVRTSRTPSGRTHTFRAG